ncbi:PREDICTED: gustatory receptor for bitter taste 22e-like, partial [Rhagoletis zephyria]|uniref:gustatory receptor for bitter taste 22e-like n=1 Tax=Rhagoletis zephyria TaxID=28612 RepID=UPI0008117DF0
MWSTTLTKLFRQTRRRIANACVSKLFLFSAAHGLYPYKYNSNTRRFTTSKWLAYYWPLANVLIITLIIYTYLLNLKLTIVELIAAKPLNILLACIHWLFSITALFVNLTRNWFGRHEFLSLHNTLLGLHNQQQRWQQKWSSQKPNQKLAEFYDNYLIAKCVMTLLQIASSIRTNLGIKPHPTLDYVFHALAKVLVKNVTLLTVANFYFALLNICQQLKQLNCNFKEVMERSAENVHSVHNLPSEDFTDIEFEMRYSIVGGDNKAKACSSCSSSRTIGAIAIGDLCRQYMELCHLTKRIYKLFEWQVLLFLAIMLYGGVMSSFYFLVYLGGKVWSKDLFSPTLFLQIFIVNILDLYCYMVLCEEAMTASKETTFLLRELYQLQGLSKDIEQD